MIVLGAVDRVGGLSCSVDRGGSRKGPEPSTGAEGRGSRFGDCTYDGGVGDGGR